MKENQFIDTIKQWDEKLLIRCSKAHLHQLFMQAVRIVSRTGDGYLQLLLPITAYLILESGEVFLQLAMLVFIFERSIYYILKNTLKRRRPPQVIPFFSSIIEASDQFSFPSGHTMAAFSLATLTVLHFGYEAYFLYLWAAMVGSSRVFLGVHFPTDIIAGAILGSSISATLFFIAV